jgi:hypothetical protein
MAFGKRKGGGDILPLLKFDARVGRFYTETRVQTINGWEKEQSDVTDRLRMTVDLANVAVGWIRFPRGAPPETALVAVGEDIGEAPSDDHREGFRCLCKMDASLGGEVREFMSTSISAWNAMSALHDDYLAEAGKHPGQLPDVALVNVIERHYSAGSSFEPVFKIIEWVPRPNDLNGMAPPQSKRAKRSDDMDDHIPF